MRNPRSAGIACRRCTGRCTRGWKRKRSASASRREPSTNTVWRVSRRKNTATTKSNNHCGRAVPLESMRSAFLLRFSRPRMASAKRAPRPDLPMRELLGSRALLGSLGWILFVGGWWLAAHAELAPARLFPGPEKVFASLWELLTEKDFASDIWASVKRILVSFAIAVSIALLVICVLFFLIIMLADVTRQVPKVYIETARTLGLRQPQILASVILRASLPGYVDVFRQLLAVSWTYLVIAEIVAATDGIGAMMMRAKRFVHIDDIMAGILVIGLLGLLFDAIFKALHRGAFRYLDVR